MPKAATHIINDQLGLGHTDKKCTSNSLTTKVLTTL